MNERKVAERSVTADAVVRFPQADPAGIVFYPRYFETVLRHFPDAPVASLPVGIKTQFLRPNRLGDRLSIEYRQGLAADDWFIVGRMHGDDCFSMQPLPVSADLPADSHHPEAPAFKTAVQPVGAWALDSEGRMYLSRYFEFVNMAIEEWFEDTLDLPFHELHVGRKTGIPTVQFDTRVQALPSGGELMSIWIRPCRIGHRAMTFVSWLVVGDRCLVRNEQVIVFVRMLEQGYESIPIPDDIAERFRQQLWQEPAD